MVAGNRDSMGMLNLICTPRPLLSPADAIGILQDRRPYSAVQAQDLGSDTTLVASLGDTQNDQFLSIPSSLRESTHSGIEIPRLTRTPWEQERHKRNSTRRKRTPTQNGLSPHVFKRLPREVYDCIIAQLEQLHMGPDGSCPSCFLKDLHSLSLTSRAWDRAATLRMYRNINIANDEHAKLPKLKIEGGSRLKLLRRTLRERKVLARMVRELHLSDFQTLYHNATIEREEIVNMVASLVMACPNLERLVGFHVPYTQSFDRLSYALSTRTALKERLWYLTDKDLEIDDDDEDDLPQGYYHAACDLTEQFLHLNSNYSGLTTLVLHQEESQISNQLTFRAIIGTLRQCRTLCHLSISGLSSTSFSNVTLNALPPYLQSLRLENLSGINDKGLQRFAASNAALSLERLTLINLEISHVATISGFLNSRLALLKRFTLAQHGAPTLPPGADVCIFECPALTHIHWELRSQAGPPPTLFPPSSTSPQTSFPFTNNEPISCLATLVLATSITAGHFPHLRRIRAPHDPQGTLQALCKPLATALIPSDNAIFTTLRRHSKPAPSFLHSSIYSKSELATTVSLKGFLATAPPDTRADSVVGSPMISCRMSFNDDDDALYKKPLDTPLVASLTPARSRLAAQSRILAARKQTTLMEFKVTDPTGDLRVDRTINGYLGDLKSPISYVLRPDPDRVVREGGSNYWDGDEEEDEEEVNQWIVGVPDVMGVGGELRGRRYGECWHALGEARGTRAVEVRQLL